MISDKTKEWINNWGALTLAIASLIILTPLLVLASMYISIRTLNCLIKENTIFLATKKARITLYANLLAVCISGLSLGSYVVVMSALI